MGTSPQVTTSTSSTVTSPPTGLLHPVGTGGQSSTFTRTADPYLPVSHNSITSHMKHMCTRSTSVKDAP